MPQDSISWGFLGIEISTLLLGLYKFILTPLTISKIVFFDTKHVLKGRIINVMTIFLDMV